MKVKKLSRVLALLLSAAMAATCLGSLPVTAQTETDSGIVSLFQNPDVHARGMFRYWLPDAATTREQLTKELTEIYEAGFGGVEIAHVPYAKNDSDDIGEYGWGSEQWRQTLVDVYEIAAELPGDFKVDVTINSAWPVALNTIDPNDEEASQEIQYAYTKLHSGSETVGLPLPAQKLAVDTGSSFIFNNRYEAATIAQVQSVTEEGVVLDYDSVKDVSAYTSETGKTTPAGIPDETDSYAAQLYADAGLSINTAEWGARAKLQDVQQYYETDLSKVSELAGYSSEGEELQEGDWVLFGFYRRGTGETLLKFAKIFPIAASMPNVAVVTDEFSTLASNALTGYWEENILNEHLTSLMQAQGGDFFEDSLENVCSTKFWNQNMIDSVQHYLDYDITPYLPFVMSTTAQGTKFISSEGDQDRFAADVDKTLNELYLNEHVAQLQSWAKNTLNMGYRAQSYSTSGFYLDVGLAAANLDVAEGESLAFGTSYDHFRAVAGGVHMSGKRYLSDEALADSGKAYALDWTDATRTINNNFAAGVNRLIIHGSPYANTENMNDPVYGDKDFWPGWHAFPLVAGAWGSRQPYWQKVTILSDYIARSQAILQNGTPKMDVAIFDTDSYRTQTPDGAGQNEQDQSKYTGLLDNGYSYDFLTPGLLTYDSATVTNKRLNEAGPAYKALVVNNLPAISLESADALLAFAEAGLPIVFCGQIPSAVFGSDASLTGSGVTGTDEQIRSKMEQLLSYETVGQVNTQEQVVSWMQQNGITPYASYSAPMVRTILRQDSDGTNYYFLYNNSGEDVTLAVTLQGSGTPYLLDAWTGEITPAAAYAQRDNAVETTLALQDGQAVFVAIAPDQTAFGETKDFHVVSSDGTTAYEDGAIVLRAEAAGSYKTIFSDGLSTTTDIQEIADPIPLNSWNLSLESWGPDEEANKTDLTVSKKTTVSFDNIPLTLWENLPATAEQLAELGVESMQNVIGIGTYSTEFTLPQNWESTQGYQLNFSHNTDMITGITVNGSQLPPVDQSADSVDIGGYLQPGSNTISVELTSTMINRVLYENPNSQYTGAVEMGMSGNKSFGLLDTVLVPYVQVVIRTGEEHLADKTILTAVLAYAEDRYASEEYENAIEQVQKTYLEALQHARMINADLHAEQDAVDQAWKDLLTQIHKLGFVRGDKTTLGQLIETAEEFLKTIDRYTPVTAEPFPAALAAAKDTYSDPNALADDVADAEQALLEAMMNLRYRADKSVLQAVLAEASAVNAAAYTPQSIELFNAANQSAKTVNGNPNATQTEVNDAAKALNDAIRNLVPVDSSIPSPDMRGDQTVTSTSSNAKTGDATPAAGIVLALLLASAAMITSQKKR